MLHLNGESEGNLIFTTGSLSLFIRGFGAELGSPAGSLCCHILSSSPTDPADTASFAGMVL